MKYQFSKHDYEQLSAYLDNQLSEKDRARIEARLKAEPELKKELTELSRTRMLVHNLPQLRAPRNYYIKAQPVAVRQPMRLAPVFGIVSAIASVMLVLVIFGSTFLKSGQPVALAPLAPPAQVDQPFQPEIQSSLASPEPTTEAAPPVMMTAPRLEASPTPYSVPTETLQSGPPSPTTIFLFAYPPTGTPEGLRSTLTGEQGLLTSEQCEGFYGGGPPPTSEFPNNCPSSTPTITPSYTPGTSQPLQGYQVLESPTPTATLTLTPSPTETPTATPTSTPTETASPTPSPTEAPPVAEKLAPTSEAASPAGLTAPNIANDNGVTTSSGQGGAESSSSGSGSSFLSYLLLTVELSLASIAIIAGIIAIIFRLRAGR